MVDCWRVDIARVSMKDDPEFSTKVAQAVESQPYLYGNRKDGYSGVTAFRNVSLFLFPLFASVA
jgi:hypothetical protein